MDNFYEQVQQVLEQVNRILIGKEECVRKVMAAILAGGHILMDDIPGVGKTTLAMAFSNALSLQNKRIQFTPDVMPSDILGFSMYQKQTGEFVYQPGAVMCNLFLGDEINRTSPKTQSALLEVMEEGSATVDGITRAVPDPFIVIATENPAGSVGTQLLPESQLDRFMICLSLGYPDLEDEIRIMEEKNQSLSYGSFQDVENPSVMTAQELQGLRERIKQIHLQKNIYRYICRLAQETRQNPYIELGVSPRGTVALMRMAQAMAFLHRRNYVIPEDVAEVFLDVAAHRIVRGSKARAARLSVEQILGDILDQVRKPTAAGR
ncbi:MAG: MoxR family ATPase [Lachnospiraceae bacterium]|nr:MoxR family ATPase [Lachnospiraceae bacterium]